MSLMTLQLNGLIQTTPVIVKGEQGDHAPDILEGLETKTFADSVTNIHSV